LLSSFFINKNQKKGDPKMAEATKTMIRNAFIVATYILMHPIRTAKSPFSICGKIFKV
jgi:hypothetical protein